MTTGKFAKKWFYTYLFLTLPCKLFASGFAVFTHGASTLGEGGASTAHGSKPEVIFFNPALMNKLDGTQVESGVTFIVPSHEFNSNLGSTTAETESAVFFPATLYLTHKYNDKISVGIGVFNPFGLGNEWEPDWEGRYITTKAEMQTFNINPVVSYQLSSSVSFAAGLDVLLVDASLQNKLNFTTLALPDGNQKFSGDGRGLGFNLGLYSELSRSISLGISYRSEIEVDIDGNVTFQLPSPALSATFPNTGGRTTITFPQQLHAAIAFSGIDRLIVELGLRWEGWSSYDELRFELDQAINGSPAFATPKNWRNTLTLTMGGRYRLNDRVHLLAGFITGEDPIPNDTFDPIVTDSSHYALTFGTEIDFHKYKLSFAYSFQNWDDRRKNTPVGASFTGGTVTDARANGRYESSSHFFATSLTYVF